MDRPALRLVFTILLVAVPTGLRAAPGDLDTTFGSGGIVTTSIQPTSNDRGWEVVIQIDGRIVVGGETQVGSGYAFALVRYNIDGTLDGTFGSGGKVVTPVGLTFGGSPSDTLKGLVLQPDGKLVGVGSWVDGSTTKTALIRWNTDGSLDPTFGTGGIATNNQSNEAFTLQSDGKFVTAGAFLLTRYNSDGSVDGTFGTGGTVLFSSMFHRAVEAVTGGKVVLAGYAGSFDHYDFALARFNADGSLDATFGSGGTVVTSIGPGTDDPADLIVQADGKLLAAGYTVDANSQVHFGLVRWNADGSVDSGFGTGGTVATPLGTGAAVVVQSDGKPVVAGRVGSPNDFVVARYTANGAVDATFGSGGFVTTSLAGDDQANAACLQADGKIVVAGYTFGGGPTQGDIAVVRYLGGTAGCS